MRLQFDSNLDVALLEKQIRLEACWAEGVYLMSFSILLAPEEHSR